MRKSSLTFGQFLADMRTIRQVTCQQHAKRIGISAAYLSHLEHGIRLNPDPKLLLQIVQVLNLSVEGSNTLSNLYAKVSGQLPPDITDYLNGNQIEQQFLRQARDINATEEDWKFLIEQLTERSLPCDRASGNSSPLSKMQRTVI